MSSCVNDLTLPWWKKGKKQRKVVPRDSFQVLESQANKLYFCMILCGLYLWNFHLNWLSVCHEHCSLSNLFLLSDKSAHKFLREILLDTFYAWHQLQCPIFRNVRQITFGCFEGKIWGKVRILMYSQWHFCAFVTHTVLL